MRSRLMRQQEASRTGDAGRASEKRLAKKIGARLQAASGAVPGIKGDMRLKDFLVEAKSTVAGTLGLKLDWLAKIRREARAEGRTPALAVTFTDAQGKALEAGSWVLVPLDTFQEMVGK